MVTRRPSATRRSTFSFARWAASELGREKETTKTDAKRISAWQRAGIGFMPRDYLSNAIVAKFCLRSLARAEFLFFHQQDFFSVVDLGELHLDDFIHAGLDNAADEGCFD